MTKNDPTNRDRAEWATNALDAFQATTGAGAEDALSDLLCDLMHFCIYDGNCGESFEMALDRARSHYAAERAEETAETP